LGTSGAVGLRWVRTRRAQVERTGTLAQEGIRSFETHAGASVVAGGRPELGSRDNNLLNANANIAAAAPQARSSPSSCPHVRGAAVVGLPGLGPVRPATRRRRVASTEPVIERHRPERRRAWRPLAKHMPVMVAGQRRYLVAQPRMPRGWRDRSRIAAPVHTGSARCRRSRRCRASRTACEGHTRAAFARKAARNVVGRAAVGRARVRLASSSCGGRRLGDSRREMLDRDPMS